MCGTKRVLHSAYSMISSQTKYIRAFEWISSVRGIANGTTYLIRQG